MSKQETVAEFLARGGRVTHGGSSMRQAPSLKRMRKEFDEACDNEHIEERRMELFGAARQSGFTMSDSLDYANEVD